MTNVQRFYSGFTGGLIAVGMIDAANDNRWMAFALLLSGFASIFMGVDQQ